MNMLQQLSSTYVEQIREAVTELASWEGQTNLHAHVFNVVERQALLLELQNRQIASLEQKIHELQQQNP